MSDTKTARNFIEEIIERDNRIGKWGSRVHTRFPPEPNGYLHIGHAKSICLNFGLAEKHSGECYLRFDDTNPIKEEQEYIDSIIADVNWLGFKWTGEVRYASDYFGQMYEWAVELIKKHRAYVDDQTPEQIRQQRGTLTAPGVESPYRNRSVEENLNFFQGMRNGDYMDGEKVLRARIDMASPNLNLRDPVMYRILRARHHRTGDTWCIYPMYDWAHGLEDSIEGVTHSICTLEFEAHRPLYDWFIDAINENRGPDSPWGDKIVHPQQIEFARLNLTYTLMSKRKLLQLVKDGYVRGWDDPRMPTLSAMRRRGYTPQAIRALCERIGVAKMNSTIDIQLLEHCVREDLNRVAPRVMVVLDPLKVTIENYPKDQVEDMDAINNPEDPAAGTRKVPFSRTIYIESGDFMEDPPRKFFRLQPGGEVRLRYAYWIRCTEVIKNTEGQVVELRCTYDPQTRGGHNPPDGRKVKGTLHWVSASHAVPVELRQLEHLFNDPDPADPGDGGDFLEALNPKSEAIITAWAEPHLSFGRPGDRFQFERTGYYCVDPDSDTERMVLNRTVTLKTGYKPGPVR